MKTLRNNAKSRRLGTRRKGAALVEFAIVAPLFLALLLGTVELGAALDASNSISNAVRGAGRLASMDWSDVVPSGMSVNDKILADTVNFLTASGLPADSLTVTITSAEGDDLGEPFDLSDPENNLRLFKIEVRIPYSAVSSYRSHFLEGSDLTESIVMRAGRVTLVN